MIRTPRALLCAAILLWPLLVRARPAADPDPVDLRATVEELRKLVAEQQTLVQSSAARVRELEERAASLTRAVEQLQAGRASDPDVRDAVDALRQQVRDLERKNQAALERERDRERTPPRPTINAGYADGIFVDVGPVKLRLNGLMQVRYVGQLNVGAGNVSTFDAHRLQLALDVRATRWLAGRIAVELGSGYFPGAPFAVPDGQLLDAFVELRPLPWLSLRAGRFLVPFARQRLVPDGLLAEAERNPATLAFAPGRDLGVAVVLAPWDGRLELTAAITNGEPAPTSAPFINPNLDLRYSARLVVSPLGPAPTVEGDPSARSPLGVGVGAAVSYDLVPTNDPIRDRDGNGVRDNVGVLQAGGELVVGWRRLSLQAEYFLRQERFGAGLPDRFFQGFYTQGQVVLLPGWLMLNARVSYAEPHTLGLALPPTGSALVDTMIPASLWDAGGSLVGFYGSHRIKVQLSYACRRSQLTVGNADAHLVQAQVSAAF